MFSNPKNDIDISLVNRSSSLFDKISKLNKIFAKGRLVSVAPLELLNRDSNRRRIVIFS